MTRRALGRGRVLIVIGCLVALAGLPVAWWLVGRTNLTPLSGNGFQGVGIVIFLGCLALLALVTLPFASRDGYSSLDRPSVYVVVGLAAILAFVLRVFEISQAAGIQLPTQAPGLWVTGAGLLVIAWGVGDILTERPASY
jgi:cation transport ATPase